MINKEKYDEYCESLLNIARLTTKENSVLINFNINGDNCSNIVSFIQQDGTKDILKDSVFVCDDDFYKEFLEKFVVEYSQTMVIAFNDSIDMNSDGKYTYRVITEDNDMMSIDGISLEYANYLMDLSKKNKEASEESVDVSSNEDGVTTAVATFIIVMGIGLSFLVMALLMS